MSKPDHIVAIGASAGGLTALSELVNQLDKDWNAAYFIVLHLSRRGIGDFLLHRLQQSTDLKCVLADDDLPVEKGTIYIALPNRHLIVKEDVIKLGRGPEENRWRPSIDVLLRSAAVAYHNRVTGIILTGLLDDGVAGMWAIKRTGGTTIVQDPNEAEYPDMPLAVLNKMDVDHCLPLSEIGRVLAHTIRTQPKLEIPIPVDVQNEADTAERVATSMENNASIGERSSYTCPDCGGLLISIEDGKVIKYRCHTGHAYTEKDLVIGQSENIEATLWVALRMMEERKNLLRKMEVQSNNRGFHRTSADNKIKGEQLQGHIENLKEVLFGIQTQDD